MAPSSQQPSPKWGGVWVLGTGMRERREASHHTHLPTPFQGINTIWRRLLLCGDGRGGEETYCLSSILAGQQRRALYLVVQRAVVLEASKASVGQADQDGEQHNQEGEQGGRGLQTWGQRRQPWGKGWATPGAEIVCDFSLTLTPAGGMVSSQPGAHRVTRGMVTGCQVNGYLRPPCEDSSLQSLGETTLG